jgi:LCP family protein required for cell wall assembly
MNRSKTIVKRVIIVCALLILSVTGWAGVQIYKIMRNHGGGDTPAGSANLGQMVSDITEIVRDPYEGFPGQDKVVILGMGIDDNWTNSDEVYTTGSRTDTLFLLTLYLKDHRATMLSIPRDTFTHIAGTTYSTKINSAYATGGPTRAIATVAEMTGVRADHYMVLNIDATKKLVDALGGVDVNVEHEMHYHDKWGHLNIDLMPGEQHLTGDQAVGFARYRHPDAGAKASPEDGDERRMYRQHVLLRAMVGKAKSFVNVAQIGSLVDTGMSQIHTDLTRTQLLDLAAIYRSIQPDSIQTASLPGEDFHGPGGAWDYRLYPDKMKAYVDWFVRGNQQAARSLTPVVIKNGTAVPRLAAHAAEFLRTQGYTDIRISGTERPRLSMASLKSRPDVAVTQILDTGVPNPEADADIKGLLNLPNAVDHREPNKPNRLGWTAPSDVTIELGQDYAQQAAGGISASVSTAPAPSADTTTSTSSGSDSSSSASNSTSDSSSGVSISSERAPSTTSNDTTAPAAGDNTAPSNTQ